MTKQKWGRRRRDNRAYPKSKLPHLGYLDVGIIDPPTTLTKRQTQQIDERREEVIAAEKVDKLMQNKDYESFLTELGEATKDPKVRALLIKGHMDGVKTDDVVKTTHRTRRSSDLKPIQKEIDLSKSLKWIGQHPENVPLILDGGPLGPEHFGGNPIVTAKGKYVVDGHHRWSQVYMVNPEVKIKSVDLNISKPEEALKISQVVIAGKTGKVEFQSVDEGKNIYKMPVSDIEKELGNYLSPKFYDAFYGHNPEKYKNKQDVHDHVLKNILTMRGESKPATKLSRGVMPQYDDVGVDVAAKALADGQINIKEPYIKRRFILDK